MLRTTQPKRLIFLRHAETIKNKQARHGGGDESLTTRGVSQLKANGGRLKNLIGSTRVALVIQPETRCVSSATILAARLGVRPQIIDALSGIDMGVVAGLSDKELALRYPLVALNYLIWRMLPTTLRPPRIKGVEPVEKFALRHERGLEQLLEIEAEVIILVGTTSGLLMDNHLLVHDGQFDRCDYRFYELGFGECAIWQLSPDAPPSRVPTK